MALVIVATITTQYRCHQFQQREESLPNKDYALLFRVIVKRGLSLIAYAGFDAEL